MKQRPSDDHLEKYLEGLDVRHREALSWFVDRAGQEHSWPKPLQTVEGAVFLTTKAKGIYKPKWSKYALSIRQSLDSPYPDLEPITHSDGSWSFAYFQEKTDPTARDAEYTNRGLINCLKDRVPIGVLRQVRERPRQLYRIHGVALVAGWSEGYFFLEGFAPDGHTRGTGPYAEIDWMFARQEAVAGEANEFEPHGVMDARERVIAQIVRRRGQPEFRRRLMAAYDSKCAMSDCNEPAALEACHIYPYMGP